MKNITDMKNSFFARHETFCPRYGWLKKGYDRVAGYNGHSDDPRIFDAEDAIERLGVGKNMVRSMRFWCMAFKVIESDNLAEGDPIRIGGPMKPTDFGQNLLSETGWDPFLEDPASLWLLHWKLFTHPVMASAWAMSINLNIPGAFTINDLGRMISDQKNNTPELKRMADSSFQKDASCFVRMYAAASAGSTRQGSEEIECPFTQLGLLAPGDSPQQHYFNTDDKPELPDLIFLAACFEYAALDDRQVNTISLNRLTYGVNSPGMVFKLSESDVGNRIERSINNLDGVIFTESYGNRQLQFEVPPMTLAEDALRNHYKTDMG